MSDLKKLFDTIDNHEKEKFLWKILQNDEEIKKRFLDKFFHEWESISIQEPSKFNLQEFLKEIKENALQISSELNQLDFEETDWDDWSPPGYYVPDYEAAEMIAEEQTDQAIGGLMDDLKTKIQFDDLTTIIAELASIVHGFEMTEINDPYDHLPEDPGEYLMRKVKDLLTEEQNNLGSRKFLLTDIHNALELILNYQKKEDCNSLLSVTADVLLSVIKTRENAQIVWQLAQDYNMDLRAHPDLLNLTVDLLGDKKLWVEMMESIFLTHYQSSEDLMKYYFESNKDMFHQKAAIFFETYQNQSHAFLSEKVEKGSQLHISILRYATLRKESISAFDELRKYISWEEMIRIIESTNDERYKIKLYNHEKMYDKIESIIWNEIKNGYAYDRVGFEESIQYLFKPKPDAAIHLTEQRINSVMKGPRDRRTYRYIALLLFQALDIPGKQLQVHSIAKDLYHHKPNLPALKDELRKADLIKP